MSALATMLPRQILPLRFCSYSSILWLNLFSVSAVIRKHTIIQFLMCSRLGNDCCKSSYGSSLRSDFRLLHFVPSPSAPTIPLESKLSHLTTVSSAKSDTHLPPHPISIDSSQVVVVQYTDTMPPIPYDSAQTPEHHHANYSLQSSHISVEARIPYRQTFVHADNFE